MSRSDYMGMNEKDANEYLEGLVKGDVKPSHGEEEQVDIIKEIYAQKSVIEQRLVRMKQQIAHDEIELQNKNGGLAALSTSLFRSEAKRRKNAADKKLAMEQEEVHQELRKAEEA